MPASRFAVAHCGGSVPMNHLSTSKRDNVRGGLLLQIDHELSVPPAHSPGAIPQAALEGDREAFAMRILLYEKISLYVLSTNL